MRSAGRSSSPPHRSRCRSCHRRRRSKTAACSPRRSASHRRCRRREPRRSAGRADVVQAPEWMVLRQCFLAEDVERGPGDPAIRQGLHQRRSSMIPPRATLMRKLLGFIAASTAAPTMPRVSGVLGSQHQEVDVTGHLLQLVARADAEEVRHRPRRRETPTTSSPQRRASRRQRLGVSLPRRRCPRLTGQEGRGEAPPLRRLLVASERRISSPVPASRPGPPRRRRGRGTRAGW